MSYRLSRNCEASLIDYFRQELSNDGWQNIQCEKSLKNEEIKLPAILIYCSNTDAELEEIGSSSFIKYPNITIRIYGKDEGSREDLADWILEKLEGNIDYYQYVVTNGQVSSKILSGSFTIRKIIRNEKEFSNTDPEALEFRDRYRHNITFSCYVGII